MTSHDSEDAGLAWSRLPKPAQRSLELAYAGLSSGGLGVGSALADCDGAIIAEGRNRAYDAGGGNERLQGSPLAHAELNVLAAVDTGRDLGTDTLWSTQQPCLMCDSALTFTGVGTVRWLAPDPWARAAEVSENRPMDGMIRIGAADDRWLVVSTVLFLASIVLRRGLEHPTIVRNKQIEPEATLMLQRLFEADTCRWAASAFPDILPSLWGAVLIAASARKNRIETLAC